MNAPAKKNRILIIKLGALGDVCLSMRYFERIRETHPDTHITMMTTAPFLSLCEKNPAFDSVIAIKRWGALDLSQWLSFISFMKKNDFDLVYDIQSNDRTSIMRRLSPATASKNWIRFAPPFMPRGGVSFKGIVLDPSVVSDMRPHDLSWLSADITAFGIKPPFALLVAGSAPQHPAKRWPASHYAELAQRLAARGITPVLIGTAADAQATRLIASACPQAVDLTARTSFAEIAALGQQAAVAIGNDTGPMHMISLCGCPVVSLFSSASDPAKSAPQGEIVRVLRADNLADVAVTDVDLAAQEIARV